MIIKARNIDILEIDKFSKPKLFSKNLKIGTWLKSLGSNVNNPRNPVMAKRVRNSVIELKIKRKVIKKILFELVKSPRYLIRSRTSEFFLLTKNKLEFELIHLIT